MLARQLTDTFRRHGLPVVLVNVAGERRAARSSHPVTGDFPPDWTDLIPEMNRKPERSRRDEADMGCVHETRASRTTEERLASRRS